MIVIVGAGIGTAIWKGNGLIPTVVTMVVVLILVSVLGSQRDTASPTNNRSKLVEPGPFSFNYSWQLSKSPDLHALERALCARGLTRDASSESELRFHRGSQIRTRFLGGYFVNPRFLPVRVEIKADRDSHQGGWELRLCAEDTLGIALRDAAARKRYTMAAAEIERFVQEGLETRAEVTPKVSPQS